MLCAHTGSTDNRLSCVLSYPVVVTVVLVPSATVEVLLCVVLCSAEPPVYLRTAWSGPHILWPWKIRSRPEQVKLLHSLETPISLHTGFQFHVVCSFNKRMIKSSVKWSIFHYSLSLIFIEHQVRRVVCNNLPGRATTAQQLGTSGDWSLCPYYCCVPALVLP